MLLVSKFTCLRWFFKMVPSGSGKGGISSGVPVGGEILLESKSINQMSSGSRKFFLNMRKLAGIPITNGVGASSSFKKKHRH